MSRHKHNNKGRSKGEGRFVRLLHWMLDTPAWKALNVVERQVYIEIAKHYAGPGSNNGRLHYSVREGAEALHVSKDTIGRALTNLQDVGFIDVSVKGGFSRKVRHATEWRLTEFMCDVTGELPTHKFKNWEPKPAQSVPIQGQRHKNTVRPQGQTVPNEGQTCPQSGTAAKLNGESVPVEGQIQPKSSLTCPSGDTHIICHVPRTSAAHTLPAEQRVASVAVARAKRAPQSAECESPNERTGGLLASPS